MQDKVFDLLPVVVSETAPVRDHDGKIVDLEWVEANQLMNRSILPDGGSVVGMRIFEFDPSYRNSEMVTNVLTVLETGEPLSFTTQQGRAAKMLRKVMRTTLTPTERGVLSCSHEVTDIANERDDALDRAELLRIACDSAIHPITITDRHGNMLYGNDALCELTGYTSETLTGQNVKSIFRAEDVERAVSAFQNVRTGARVQHTADAELITESGQSIRVSVAINSARLPGRRETVFITHIQDVREERRKAHELRDALYRAEQATRLKSEFLANMSHEIRTPLNGVLGMAQTLANDSLTSSQAEQVSIILESGRALMVLLNDILDLSKIEAGRLEITPVAGDLRHTLSGLSKLHEAAAQEKGISLKLFIDPAVPSGLVFDPVRVRQCVGNLVANAIKFTSEGEVLIVVTCDKADPDNTGVTIHVSDTGCGIAPDKLDRIFESFAQEDGSITRKFGGTGLGLSITRKLARMMDGDVSVVSKPGRGSVFTLKFSVDTLESVPAPGKPHSPIPVDNRRARLSDCRALVVDDNEINLRVARTFLEYYGVDTLLACDGHQALEILARETVDIVLMDIHMPGLDGTEAFRRLRLSDGANRLVPVIALTADSMQGDREKFLSLGFDGYVSKPLDERMLMSAIGKVLNTRSRTGPLQAAG